MLKVNYLDMAPVYAIPAALIHLMSAKSISAERKIQKLTASQLTSTFGGCLVPPEEMLKVVPDSSQAEASDSERRVVNSWPGREGESETKKSSSRFKQTETSFQSLAYSRGTATWAN